jgi:hypothetical protein
MTPEEAKRILALYRPGSADQDDPAFAEALDMADPGRQTDRRVAALDPELSRWFREHCAAFLDVRGKFLNIQPPPALKDQILAEYKSHMMPAPLRARRPVVLAYAACAVVMAALLTVFFVRRAQHDFSLYRQLVVAQALKPSYSMDLESTNLASINVYLAGRHAPADYLVPPSLASAKPVGCAVIDWHGKPAVMLCFRSGRPLGPGEVADVWLFVADQDDVVHAPANAARAVAEVDRMATAAWSQGGKLYVLGTIGDEAALQKYF